MKYVRKICTCLLVPALLFSTACRKQEAQEIETQPKEEEIKDKSTDEIIAEMIEDMSTEEKLAQMMIVPLRSDPESGRAASAITPAYTELLQKYAFGGLILFAGNIIDTAQTVTFIHDAQNATVSSKHGIPLFVCVDQEGGIVNRVSFGTTGPGNMALAAAGDTALTQESAGLLGQEIAAFGFNMDFAPVCDVNNNPANPIIGTRSFSDDPELAAKNVTAFISGLQENHILSALKHFPGHGNVGEDSHTGLPCSLLTVNELKNCELIPFQAGIDAGADMIMTAHIQFPEIETNTYISKQSGEAVTLPATLSRTIITDLLRKEMGYDGIVITDAMEMGAISAHFDPIDAAVLAINADADILLCPVDLYQDDEVNTFPEIETYMQGLLQRFEAGDIKEEELDNSVFRILKLKYEKGIMPYTGQDTIEDKISNARSSVGDPAHLERDWQIAEKAMTLLKNENHVLPLNGNSSTLILVSHDYWMPTAEYAVRRLEQEGLLDSSNTTLISYSYRSFWDEDLQQALTAADQLVIFSAFDFKYVIPLMAIDQIHAQGGSAVLLSLNLPYDAAVYENADAILCAYNAYGSAHDADGNGPFNLNVAVALCTAFGASVPSGTLPVNIPRIVSDDEGYAQYQDDILYWKGYGLENWGD